MSEKDYWSLWMLAEAKLARCLHTLEKIADTDPDDGVHWFHSEAERAIEDVKNYPTPQKGCNNE